MLDTKLVLKHDKVPLSGAVLHLLLEFSTQSIERGSTWSDLVIGEETNPAKTSKDTTTFFAAGKGSLGSNGRLEVTNGRRRHAEDLLRGLLPGDRGVQEVSRLIAQKANIDYGLDHLRESLVTEGTTDDCLGFGNSVTFTERCRVTVRVCNEGETGINVVGLCGAHQVRASNTDNLSILVELGIVAESKENTTAGPGEFITQWIIRIFSSRKSSTVRDKRCDLAPSGVNLYYMNK